jgi:hypothetical protein
MAHGTTRQALPPYALHAVSEFVPVYVVRDPFCQRVPVICNDPDSALCMIALDNLSPRDTVGEHRGM